MSLGFLKVKGSAEECDTPQEAKKTGPVHKKPWPGWGDPTFRWELTGKRLTLLKDEHQWWIEKQQADQNGGA